MQTMKSDLFRGILDAIDIASEYYESCVKTLVGCAFATDKPSDRYEFIREAQEYQGWKRELYDLKKEIASTYIPIDE